jgi:hypothetical protein
MSKVDPEFVARLETLWRSGPRAEREALVGDIARDVGKLGVLSASEAELRAMRIFFGVADAVALYEGIRDMSLRFEGEWREEFIAYFPESRDVLPRQRMTDEEYDAWLRAEGGDF